MTATKNDSENSIHDIAYYAEDGRLTGEPDGRGCQWREMISRFWEVGRMLTEEEAEEFCARRR